MHNTRWYKHCSLKHKHNTGWYGTVLSDTHTQYRVVWIYPPDTVARKVESWRPGIIPGKWDDVDPGGESSNVQGIPRRTAAKAILESLCYTRRNGAAVIQADGCPIPGSSRRCSAQHNSPGGGDVLIYTSGSRRQWGDWQSIIYTRVAWETAITKSKSSFLFITGHFQILFIPGHFPDFVCTRSLPDFVYKRGGMILNHTSVRGAASAWAAGTLP